MIKSTIASFLINWNKVGGLVALPDRSTVGRTNVAHLWSLMGLCAHGGRYARGYLKVPGPNIQHLHKWLRRGNRMDAHKEGGLLTPQTRDSRFRRIWIDLNTGP